MQTPINLNTAMHRLAEQLPSNTNSKEVAYEACVRQDMALSPVDGRKYRAFTYGKQVISLHGPWGQYP